MDAEKHVRDGIRLNQVLNGKLPDFIEHTPCITRAIQSSLYPNREIDVF